MTVNKLKTIIFVLLFISCASIGVAIKMYSKHKEFKAEVRPALENYDFLLKDDILRMTELTWVNFDRKYSTSVDGFKAIKENEKVQELTKIYNKYYK